jgi:hypothetical protein
MFAPRIAIVLMACCVLALATCLVASCQPATSTSPATAEAKLAVAELNQDIETLGSLNRLDLQPKQVQSLLTVLERLRADVAKDDAQRQAALSALVPLLREKRTALLQDKPISDDLDKRIRDAQVKVDALDDQQQQTLGKYGAEFRGILSAAQIDILTGADQARSQAEELLTWIRGMGEAEFTEEGKANATELADYEIGLPANVIMKLFTDVRKLSEAEWTKNRAPYVAKLAPLYMPMKEAADDTVVQFFAAPHMLELLKQRPAAPAAK